MIKKFSPFTFTYSKNFLNIFILRSIRKILNLSISIIFKFFRYKILTSPLEAIGHQCWDLECINIDNEFNEKKHIILIPRHEKFLGNKYFFDNFQKERLIKKHSLKFINSKIFCVILYFQRYFKNITLNTDHFMANDHATSFKLIKDHFTKYHTNEKLHEDGKKLIKKYNLELGKKFILLHARDASFKPFDNERYRDTDIDTFSNLIDYLIEKKYQIVRLGNKGMKKSKFNNKIIDLTQLEILPADKEILDVYLAAYCDYMVGTCSGLGCLAAMFGKKILSTNMAPHSFSLSINSGLSIPKIYKFNEDSKILKFEEVVSLNLHNLRHDDYYKSNSLHLIDNSPDEIVEAFKDLEVIDNNIKENELQKKFRETLNKNNIISHSFDSSSSIAPSFIKKYIELL